jgi:hypothetical protein
MNVGEYKTLDLVKDNSKGKKNFFCTIIFEMQEKGYNVLFQPRCKWDFGHYMAAVYVQKFFDWSNEPLHSCSKCCIKTAQMCPICLLITSQVQNCALSWNNSMVFFHCNSYYKLDSAVREFKLSANIRYFYVLGNVLVTYNLMLIALPYFSLTVPRGTQQSCRGLKSLNSEVNIDQPH